MIGGRDYNESPFNLATQGQRQPGSAFKPFILATALQQGISPGSTWTSQKKTLHSKALGCDFDVNNYEDAYAGVRTLANATTFSDNAVYAEVGLKVGVAKIAKTAERMGIRTPISKNCSMTLGGLREGVTPLDMAHAYQTFATGGKFVTGTLGPDRGPVGIKEIGRKEDDGDVDVLRENKKKTERVLPEDVAGTAREILSTVVTSGTAVKARLTEFAAGKTGTTENYGDAWFVGFTDRMTVAVWVGYPDKLQPMTTEYRGQPVAGGTFPAEIWRDFMVAVRAAYEARENERREKEGLPPVTTTTTTPAPATEVPAAEAAQEETPTPGGGDPRPEYAPEGTQAPAPAEPQEQPAQPAPQQNTPAAPPGDESGGAGAPSG
jgi:penicillin-binding protein 1A